MIDEELRQLGEAPLDRALDSLESDIWRRIAVRSRHRAAARRRVSLQSLVLIVGVMVSIVAGMNAARSTTSAHGSVVLALGSEWAPSSLLLGRDP